VVAKELPVMGLSKSLTLARSWTGKSTVSFAVGNKRKKRKNLKK
jgi:hypothetical protein